MGDLETVVCQSIAFVPCRTSSHGFANRNAHAEPRFQPHAEIFSEPAQRLCDRRIACHIQREMYEDSSGTIASIAESTAATVALLELIA